MLNASVNAALARSAGRHSASFPCNAGEGYEDGGECQRRGCAQRKKLTIASFPCNAGEGLRMGARMLPTDEC